MGFSLLTLDNYKKVFHGNMSCKGVTAIKGAVKQYEKVESESYLDKTPITDSDIRSHLLGEKSIGMSPITEDGNVYFGVIDVDKYTKDISNYVKTIYQYNIPLVPFYSKSGGLHLYVFFSEPTEPSKAKYLLNDIRQLLGLPKNTEIFPKQMSKDSSMFSSWINLPYFDAYNGNNVRKMVSQDLHLVPIEEALQYAIMSKKSVPEYKEALSKMVLNDAPPCLQSLYITGTEDNRNNYLFSLAVYLKSKFPDSYEEELTEANLKLSNPLSEQELHNTILKTMSERTYSYRCGQAPLCDRCSKELCEVRKYGKECDTIASINFEEFSQYNTDPPYYVWVINGQPLKFYSEEDIINQRVFRNLCMRTLHILPKKLSDPKWTQIINNALSNIVVHEVDKDNDMSAGGLWVRYVTDFFTNRVLADNPKQIKIGRVYRDPVQGLYIFRASDFIEYIRVQKGFKAYSEVQMQSKLVDAGAKMVDYKISEAETLSLWCIECNKIDSKKVDITDVDIDFYDKETPDDKY